MATTLIMATLIFDPVGHEGSGIEIPSAPTGVAGCGVQTLPNHSSQYIDSGPPGLQAHSICSAVIVPNPRNESARITCC